jgi:hypothetical protein
MAPEVSGAPPIWRPNVASPTVRDMVRVFAELAELAEPNLADASREEAH